jgi:uncharacterized protein (TIGR00730 family)
MRAVCIFCGSNHGARPSYSAAARAAGEAVAKRRLTLVYGGGKVGLMGELAEGALAAGGEVVGVMPEALIAREIGHDRLTALHVVKSMHARKALMADLADGFIALPGGAGTMEEFFEAWTWGQLGHHDKPVGLVNVDGFFDALVAFVRRQTEEKFMRVEHRDMLLVDADAGRLLDRFEGYRPPTVEKWIRRSET